MGNGPIDAETGIVRVEGFPELRPGLDLHAFRTICPSGEEPRQGDVARFRIARRRNVHGAEVIAGFRDGRLVSVEIVFDEPPLMKDAAAFQADPAGARKRVQAAYLKGLEGPSEHSWGRVEASECGSIRLLFGGPRQGT